MYLLSGQNITCGYNSIDIVFECDIGVNKGEIASIVGPNGAGKSTVMKSLFGLILVDKELENLVIVFRGTHTKYESNYNH